MNRRCLRNNMFYFILFHHISSGKSRSWNGLPLHNSSLPLLLHGQILTNIMPSAAPWLKADVAIESKPWDPLISFQGADWVLRAKYGKGIIGSLTTPDPYWSEDESPVLFIVRCPTRSVFERSVCWSCGLDRPLWVYGVLTTSLRWEAGWRPLTPTTTPPTLW